MNNTIIDLQYQRVEYYKNKNSLQQEYENMSVEEQVKIDEQHAQEMKDHLVNFKRPIDYDFWGKRFSWTFLEAALLMSNISPKDISYNKWTDIKNYLDQSDENKYLCSEKKLLLIEDYYSGKCLKSCHRSIESGWGYDVVEVVFRPQDIVEWSENYKIEMPEALKDVVKSIYNPENWQEKYKQLQNKVKILEQQLANISKPQISLKELAEIERVLDVKTEKTYDRVLATVALSFIKQKNDLNGTRIESISLDLIPRSSASKKII